MKCYNCIKEASHYMLIVFELKGWLADGTDYDDHYMCKDHVVTCIESFFNLKGVEVLEISVKKLGD